MINQYTAESVIYEAIRQDLVVPLGNVDISQMLEFWRWLIPVTYQPLFVTALGDLFLAAPDESVWWLDMGDGQLKAVAASDDEFRRGIADHDNNGLWFGALLVDRLRAAGKFLSAGEGYCYLLLPMRGGEFEPANFRVYDVVHHLRIWGPIHEKLREVPDGTDIVLNVVD